MARILISEPNDDIRSLLERYVTVLGHEVVGWAGGGSPPDLAIIEPGDPDGYQLAKSLRVVGVRLVFVSIYPPTEDTLAMQPETYLVKPFSRDRLAKSLMAALSATSEHPA